MAFSYLQPDTLFQTYKDAKSYTDSLTDQFPDWQRIARNKPLDGIKAPYPRTTDGTTASIIRKTPRRVIQQVPTGVVKTDDEDWLGIVAGFIYTNKILPHANEDYDLIQKGWNIVETGLTFGACPTYAPFLDHDGYFCPDLTVPYWGDIFFQRGKKSGYACKYIFMRSWWQKADLQALIDRDAKLSKGSKSYKSTWDTKGLTSILDDLQAKEDKAKTSADKGNSGTANEGIELVTGFQTGVGAKFYTFHPGTETIVRTKINKDPRGKMPIDWMYGDIDGSNPWGRGIVELVGPLQNLIDADMQMYQFNRALMLAPPVVKKGNFSKNKIKYIPNQIIDLGTDPNASVDTLKIDSTAIANYPALYGLQKSQLLNLTASPDTSISSDVGNPGFSKTPAGINQQQATISVDDNYVRKMFETWFQNWSETAINLFFAERTGIEDLQLDQDTADKLLKLAERGKFDPSTLNDQNVIRIDYDTATPALRFEVDASTSKMKDDSKQQEGLTGLLTALDQSPILQQAVPPEKVLAVWNSMVSASGVEDPEELRIDIKALKQQQNAAAQAQQAQMGGQPQPGQMPPDQPQPPQDLHPEEQQIAQLLQQAGATPDQIGRALAMLQAGHSEQEILSMLGGQHG